MIIGISGKSQGGKDTVATIIQYYLSNSHLQVSLEEFLKWNSEKINEVFQIHRFGEALKQVTSIILNIPREDLEKEEVKQRVLPECWNRWRVDDLSIGKSFLFPSEELALEKAIDLDIESPFDRYEHSVKFEPITVRTFLQEVGTDAFRDVIHPNTWVNAFFGKYEPQYFYAVDDDNLIEFDAPMFPKWICPDVRFQNEVSSIKDGIPGYELNEYDTRLLVRVESNRIDLSNPKYQHQSETGLDDHNDWDGLFTNNGTIPELAIQVKEFLEEQNLISE